MPIGAPLAAAADPRLPESHVIEEALAQLQRA
jgi:hypothetical protein